MLFALWDGEEKGLLGSKHWVANPTVPLDKVRLVINMDMVGRLRNDQVTVFGSRSMPGLPLNNIPKSFHIAAAKAAMNGNNPVRISVVLSRLT